MAEEIKTESDVYKELYEKEKKENDRLRVQAIKAQAAKPTDAPTTAKQPPSSINPNGEIIALKLDYEGFKQEITRAVSSAITQLNLYGGEQEKIRTQVKTNYQNITAIQQFINNGGK